MQMANAQPSLKFSTQRPASNQLQLLHDDGWGHATRSFTASANKKAQLVVKFEVVERVAKEFSNGNTHILESLSAPEAPEDPFNDADECANLVDNNSNDD